MVPMPFLRSTAIMTIDISGVENVSGNSTHSISTLASEAANSKMFLDPLKTPNHQLEGRKGPESLVDW